MSRPLITIMISSRCNDKFPIGENGIPLSDVRKEIKNEIEGIKLFDKQIFKVWISEDEPPGPGSNNSRELCIKQARGTDLMLVLYNGNAGWDRGDGSMGICHEELQTAYNDSPAKVSLVSLIDNKQSNLLSDQLHKKFQEYVNKICLFNGASISSVDELKIRSKEAICESFLNIARLGIREAKKSRYNTGPALDWSRLDFRQRQKCMTAELMNALSDKPDAQSKKQGVLVPIGKKKINTFFLPTAIPGSLTISTAKEMVGQPFLKDHLLVSELKKSLTAGPVHLIACYKSVTESQAIKILGFPDATIIAGSFGLYIADNIQKIQLCLISNCRDAFSTQSGLDKLFEWLNNTDEADFLASRAKSRAKIVKVIAKLIDKEKDI